MNLVHFGLLTFLGIIFVVFVARLFRRGRLSMRYTLGWLLIGLLAMFYLPVFVFLEIVGEKLDIQPVAILLGMPLIVLGLVCIQISISISGLTNAVRGLSEKIALIEGDLKIASDVVKQEDLDK